MGYAYHSSRAAIRCTSARPDLRSQIRPARMFAATNMLVCVLLLLHFCAELLFSLCVSRSGRLRSCRGRAVRHANGGYGGQLDPCEKLISLERTSVLRAYKQFLLAKVSLFAVRLPVLIAVFPLRF